jgi:predicted metal-dependent hydrolase
VPYTPVHEQQLTIQGIAVQVEYKPIKHLRLSVHPPEGQVRVSAPLKTNREQIERMVTERAAWIKKHQSTMQAKPQPSQLQYTSNETHYLFDQPLQLDVSETTGRPNVKLVKPNRLQLRVPRGATAEHRALLLQTWYHRQMQAEVEKLLVYWQPILGQQISGLSIKPMKTRWGSCNVHSHRINLNLELAKRPRGCLEYVLVHELVHLLVPGHNQRFYDYLDQFLPDWRYWQDLLKQVPPLGED